MITVSSALVTANGVPETSVAPVTRSGSVPQINELRVLLAPPFMTVFSCTDVVVNDAMELEMITGMRTNTFDKTGDLVTPEALLASNA